MTIRGAEDSARGQHLLTGSGTEHRLPMVKAEKNSRSLGGC